MLSDAGGVPQVFLTAPSGTVQIPVSAVQLHQVRWTLTWPTQPVSPGQVLERQASRRRPSSACWSVSPSCPHTPPSLQMAVIGQQAGSSSNLTELQVVNLDATHSTKSE